MDSESEGYQATADFIIPKRKTYFETKKTIMKYKLPQKCQTYFGFPWQTFRQVSGKKTVFHRPTSVIIGKNCAVCLEFHPRAQFFFPIRSFRLMSNVYLFI